MAAMMKSPAVHCTSELNCIAISGASKIDAIVSKSRYVFFVSPLYAWIIPGLYAFSKGALLAASIPIEITFLVSKGSMMASTHKREAA